MKWLLLTIFISAEPNKPPGNSIKAYDSYKECEEALITINNIDETINGNKAELFKDMNGFTASKVLFEPVPAIIGTLLSAILIVSSIIFLCSLCDKVGDSPVVPQGTRP